jgi:hypothetical protein
MRDDFPGRSDKQGMVYNDISSSFFSEGRAMRRFWVTVSALLSVFLLAVVVIPFFIPWSPLNCWHEEVDITTGRIRRQWMLLFVKVAESIEETPLSEVVLRS